MRIKDLKKKFPEWVKKNKLNDDDIVYMVGEKIKVLRKNQ